MAEKINLLYKQPIIFGEVLFDVFADGTSVLGGAPFNVAWHLTGFGCDPIFISRIGEDEAGEQVIEAMRTWDMDTHAIQYDDTHPTGMVPVVVKDGQPTFDIIPDQAYDHISYANIPSLQSKFLYHGSLITRSFSKNALQMLIKKQYPFIFSDINLRSPWWNVKDANKMIRNARWVKLNEDELSLLQEKRLTNREETISAAMELYQRYSLELLLVTLGSEGSFYICDGQSFFIHPVPVDNIIDTVGAGDAFSAVTILGLCCGWPWKQTLQRATNFASEICQRQGATIKDKKLYRSYIQSWSR